MSLLIREKVAQERGRRHSAALSLTPCRKKQSRYVTEADIWGVENQFNKPFGVFQELFRERPEISPKR